jgi:DNA-binding HxlR family transcriptional regulator
VTPPSEPDVLAPHPTAVRLGEPDRARPISSVVRALDVLSDAWTFLVLREAFFGVRRFDELQRGLGVARNILSDRLDHLVREGILTRVAYQDRPTRFEYRLTQAGRDFYPAIVEFMRWGDRWQPAPGGPPLTLFERGGGVPIRPQVVCAHCRRPVSPFAVEVREGPGAGIEELHPAEGAGRRRSAGAADLYTRGRPCAVARTLALIGDRWSFRILRESFFGVRRFDELASHTGAARNILADRLERLVEGGVLERRLYQERPKRFEYILTAAGLDLYPAFLLLMRWGDRWRRPAEGVPLLIIHKACGRPTVAELVNAETGRAIDPRDVTFRAAYDLGGFGGENRR